MKRALVLGGGGVIGVAWESGLVIGLREGGVDFSGFDAIVGTSAGAMVGARIASGRLPEHPDARASNRSASEAGRSARRAIRAKMDMHAVGQIFTLWGTMTEATAEQVAAIGKIVRGLDRSAEADFIAHINDGVEVADWPEARLCVVAVDTETGERRVFERDGGAAFSRVIAATAAVPGLFPAIEIDGRLYMDGQVYSSTNADLLVPYRPVQVVIAMPTNAATAPGIGAHAERMLELEIGMLREAGCEVLVKTPSSEDTQRMGTNLMDAARAGEAFDVGLGAGRAWAATLARVAGASG